LKIYHIDSSARKTESVSKSLAKLLVEKIKKSDDTVTYRDVSTGLPLVSGIKGSGFIIPENERTEADKKLFKISDELIKEFKSCDTLVISAPIYNFGPPASLKTWFDLIARNEETFRYTEQGPVGITTNIKKAYLLIVSGGVKVNSNMDFCTPWLKQGLNFLGVKDIEVIAADSLNGDPQKIEKTKKIINSLK
jgi:FMN-dependent NADH-azoreductase